MQGLGGEGRHLLSQLEIGRRYKESWQMTTRWMIGRRAGWRWSGATAEEMQISRWRAADQILLVPGGEDSAVHRPCNSTIQSTDTFYTPLIRRLHKCTNAHGPGVVCPAG